jgi:hypothetical protein
MVVKFAIISEDLIDEERRQLLSKGVKFDVGEATCAQLDALPLQK